MPCVNTGERCKDYPEKGERMGKKISLSAKEKRNVINLLASGESIRNTAAITNRSLKAVASLKKTSQDTIDAMKDVINMKIIQEAQPSIKKIIHLRDHAKREELQFSAAKELLDKAETRVGTTPNNKVTMIFNLTKEETNEHPRENRQIIDGEIL